MGYARTSLSSACERHSLALDDQPAALESKLDSVSLRSRQGDWYMYRTPKFIVRREETCQSS